MATNRVVLIDDDPDFREIAQHFAATYGFELDAHPSLIAMVSFAKLGEYEAIISDFHLEQLKGSEIAEYVERFFPHIPFYIVSGDREIHAKQIKWPKAIRAFFAKQEGVPRMFAAIKKNLNSLAPYQAAAASDA